MSLSFKDLREGQHCRLRAWKSRHSSSGAERGSDGGDARLAAVHALARPLFAGAVDARAGTRTYGEVVARTRALIAAGAPRVLNAAFDVAGLRATVDVLERTPRGRWIAVLVRSGVRVSWSLAGRGAFTLHVLRCEGVAVAAVHALLLDPEYVRPEGGIDPAALFVRRSISFAARRRLPRIALDAAAVHGVHASPAAPAVAPGAHCREDRDGCPFLGDCTAGLPDDWTGWFPRKDKPPIAEWLARGYVRMRDVPDDRQLPRGAEHARLVSRTGRAHVSAGLATALAAAGPPAFYLDFECVAPGVPAFVGTRPYEVIPFLWSLHHDDGAGGLAHVDDIAPPGVEAPRRRIAAGLIAALGGSSTPIVVYSGYEGERLRELAGALPDLAAALDAIQARLVDLLEIVREHVYDLRFRGSFSIKQVAPVLAPGLTYDDLAVRDGLAASEAYERLLESPGPGAGPVEDTLSQLRAYCARDTLALVALHRALLALATDSSRRE